MSTPRMDAAAVVCYGEGGIESSLGFRAVPLQDARQLETELATERQLRERTEAERDEWKRSDNEVRAFLRTETDTLRAEVAATKEAFDKCVADGAALLNYISELRLQLGDANTEIMGLMSQIRYLKEQYEA